MIIFVLLDFVASHGIMVYPVPRQGGTPFELGGHESQGRKNARYNFGRDGNGARRKKEGKHGKDYTWLSAVDERLAVTWVKTKLAPWATPGTAMPYHACGRKNRNPKDKNGLWYDLKPNRMVTWKRGTTQQVAWTAFHNHQGGYAYRLLKVPDVRKDVKELDFQANTLEFEGNTSIVRTTDGREIEIPAVRGFFTANNFRQHWTRNPIPENKKRPYGLPKGLKDANFYSPWRKNQAHRYWNWKFSLVDKVKIPANLEPGHYYISWRWDAGSEVQMWTNCGDVNIVEDGDSTALPEGGPAWGEEGGAGEPEPEPEEEEAEPEPETEDDVDQKSGGLLQTHSTSGRGSESERRQASISQQRPDTDDDEAEPESEFVGAEKATGGSRKRRRKTKSGGKRMGGSGAKRRRKKKLGGGGKSAGGLLQTDSGPKRPVLKGGKLVQAQVGVDGDISLG